MQFIPKPLSTTCFFLVAALGMVELTRFEPMTWTSVVQSHLRGTSKVEPSNQQETQQDEEDGEEKQMAEFMEQYFANVDVPKLAEVSNEYIKRYNVADSFSDIARLLSKPWVEKCISMWEQDGTNGETKRRLVELFGHMLKGDKLYQRVLHKKWAVALYNMYKKNNCPKYTDSLDAMMNCQTEFQELGKGAKKYAMFTEATYGLTQAEIDRLVFYGLGAHFSSVMAEDLYHHGTKNICIIKHSFEEIFEELEQPFENDEINDDVYQKVVFMFISKKAWDSVDNEVRKQVFGTIKFDRALENPMAQDQRGSLDASVVFQDIVKWSITNDHLGLAEHLTNDIQELFYTHGWIDEAFEVMQFRSDIIIGGIAKGNDMEEKIQDFLKQIDDLSYIYEKESEFAQLLYKKVELRKQIQELSNEDLVKDFNNLPPVILVEPLHKFKTEFDDLQQKVVKAAENAAED